MLALGFDLLTYRKGRTRQIAEERFTKHQARLDGRKVEYLLHDQAVRFLKRKLRLRQITRLSPNGHQTPALTSRWDLQASEDRKSTRLNSSHGYISYAVFCLKKK